MCLIEDQSWIDCIDITSRWDTFVSFHLYGNKGVSLPLWPIRPRWFHTYSPCAGPLGDGHEGMWARFGSQGSIALNWHSRYSGTWLYKACLIIDLFWKFASEEAKCRCAFHITYSWDGWAVIGPVIHGESKSQAIQSNLDHMGLLHILSTIDIHESNLGCILYWRFGPNWWSEKIWAGNSQTTSIRGLPFIREKTVSVIHSSHQLAQSQLQHTRKEIY